MDGFVFLDKPAGMRSSDATVAVKNLLGAGKAGHSGTLDPRATGVLAIGLDGALGFMGKLAGLDKVYEGVIKLHADVPAAEVKETARWFVGDVVQIPPKKSAVARRERVRNVRSFDVLSVSGREVRFRLKCEAGFYVRKLAHDLGLKLGTRAQLWTLRRTAVGPFGIGMCATIGRISKEGVDCVRSARDVMGALGVKFTNSHGRPEPASPAHRCAQIKLHAARPAAEI